MAPVCGAQYGINSINFIKTIEKHECIWNSRIPEHNKRNEIKATWKIISDEFEEPIAVIRERWRNIRNTFIRSMKKYSKTKDIDSGSKTKEYYLAKYLKFLIPHIQHHFDNKSNNSLYQENATRIAPISSDDGEESDEETLDEDKFMNSFTINKHSFIKNKIEEAADEFSRPDQQLQEAYRQNKIQSKTQIQKRSQLQNHSQNLNPLQDDYIAEKKKKVDYDENSQSISFSLKDKAIEQQDANIYFLKSLLPDFNTMTSIQNRRFRRKVITLMDDILNDNDLVQNQGNNDLSARSISQSQSTILDERNTPDSDQNVANYTVKKEIIDLN